MKSDILFYFQNYFTEILLSLPYFAIISIFGVFLLLRRTSLFAAVLSKTAQIGFLIGSTIHFQDHEAAYDLINRTGGKNIFSELLHLDFYIYPITLLLLFPFLLYSRKEIRNTESSLLILFVFFTGIMPLIHKILGGNESSLLKLYFTEILYTPKEMFVFYIPHILIPVTLLFIFFSGIFLSGYDSTQARLSGYNPKNYTFLFFVLTSIIISASIRVLGIYVALTAMLAPPMAILNFARNMKVTLIFTPILSILLAFLGFTCAFLFPNFPAEPIIISIISLGSFLIKYIFKIIENI